MLGQALFRHFLANYYNISTIFLIKHYIYPINYDVYTTFFCTNITYRVIGENTHHNIIVPI